MTIYRTIGCKNLKNILKKKTFFSGKVLVAMESKIIIIVLVFGFRTFGVNVSKLLRGSRQNFSLVLMIDSQTTDRTEFVHSHTFL